MEIQQALDYVKKNRERFLEDLKGLINIPSVSGEKRYHADLCRCADAVMKQLMDAGLSNVRALNKEKVDEAPIVYGEWIDKANDFTVLIYGHYDVVGVENKLLWDTEPFEATVKGDYIFGRGANDDKGQLLTSIKAVESIMKTQGRLPVNVKFIIEGGEESVSGEIQEALTKPEIIKLLSADVVMISDGDWFDCNQPTITSGLRGWMALEVNISGPKTPIHSGVYGGAVANPINILSDLLGSMFDQDGRIQVPGFYDSVVEISKAEKAEFKKLAFDEEEYKSAIGVNSLYGEKGYTTYERIMGRPCIDITGIWGGYVGEGYKSAIPSTSGAKVSVRLVPNQNPEKLLENFQRFFEERCPDGVVLDIKSLGSGNAYMLSLDEPLLRGLKKIMKEVFGREPILARCGASLPIVPVFEKAIKAPVLLAELGLPTANPHSDNENFVLDHYYKGMEMYIRVFHEIGHKASEKAVVKEKKILVIDDDPDVLVLWKNMLKSLGEEAPILVSNGTELKSQAINYDDVKLAVVDFKFEGSEYTGTEIIEFLRKNNVKHVYLSSGYAHEEKVCRESRAMGAEGIIAKPVTKEKVKKLLEEMK